MADLGSERADPLWATSQFAPLQWAATQMGAADRLDGSNSIRAEREGFVNED